ncbi:hypothetical protein DM790_23735 [Flavobacterium collinsii]|nr:hypothetical protein [Flavobacterium collinsii]
MIENGIHENLEHLTIGFEHSNSEYGYKDYSKISSLLSTAKFPKLKTFEYGTDFLIVNEEQYYPHLGDLTQVLNNMPLLEELDVSGSFQLQSKVDLKNIKNLYIMDYYTEITNGTISKDTINFLTDSNLENLEIFELSLGAQNDYVYQLNSKIFLKNIDKLKLLAIDGKFEKGTKDKLQTLLNPYIEKLFLNDTEE